MWVLAVATLMWSRWRSRCWKPFGYFAKDLAFAVGEDVEPVGGDRAGFDAGGEILDETPGDGGGEKGLAGGHGPDGVEELFGGVSLSRNPLAPRAGRRRRTRRGRRW